MIDEVSTAEHVESVADPFAAGTISADGRIGYAELTLDVPEREMGKPAFAVLSEAVSGIEAPGLRVELGGDAVFLNAADESSAHMGIGLLVALLVLLVVFGTLVAAVVPIGLVDRRGRRRHRWDHADGRGHGRVGRPPSPSQRLVGLGVGVDYALFVVARYRENRSSGQDNDHALAHAMGTSGAAVVFAGGTVVIATAALAITGLGILTSIGLATALMVFSLSPPR